MEALLLGRRFVGVDLNPLSVFVSRVKTTPLASLEVSGLLAWLARLPTSVNLHRLSNPAEAWSSYQRHIPWWLRKTLEQALLSVNSLSSANQRRFARGLLLQTAQRALDCRRDTPTKDEFISVLKKNLSEMLHGISQFSAGLKASFGTTSAVYSHRRLLLRDARGVDNDRRIPRSWKPVRLVLTSPPYMGVHVLYHRWQVMSRRETAAPYWISGLEDGHSSSFYTLGPRLQREWSEYLVRLKEAFASVIAMMARGGHVVQLVGFSTPPRQINAYLDALQSAGLEEVRVRSGLCGRLWREVPNRKWYAGVSDGGQGSKEVLLVHRKVGSS